MNGWSVDGVNNDVHAKCIIKKKLQTLDAIIVLNRDDVGCGFDFICF